MENRKDFDFAEKSAVCAAVADYLKSGAKADGIFDRRFRSARAPEARAGANAVFKSFLRNFLPIKSAVCGLCKKSPRPALKAALFCACADLIMRRKTFQAVDPWVEFIKVKFSKGESGFANALLRKIPEILERTEKEAEKQPSPENLSMAYSHPEWLVKKWISEFGAEETVKILKNNRIPSDVFLRSSGSKSARDLEKKFENSLRPSPFENFKILEVGHWKTAEELLESGEFYAQDPSTSFAPELLNPKTGESILDLCAAPGGKSRMCADLVLRSAGFDRSACSNSLLVSVDLPGPRMEKLSENLSKIDFIKSHSIASDLVSGSLAGELEKRGLPTLFNRVLLDAPCSNTGVLRRRPDARYRLEEEDISSCSELQKTLMAKAAKFTSRGGSFVYSTCSIEREENSENAEWFTGNFPDFELVQSKICIPGAFNDGGGSFLFKRRS